MKTAILITNPNHHLELTLGVARKLRDGGDNVKYVSLCEMRRMPSPVEVFEQEDLEYIRFGKLPDNLKPSSGKKSLGKSDSKLRKIVQRAFWVLKLKPFIKEAFKGVDKVLLLNDAAFPGNRICAWLNSQKIPFDLLQEGIRFPLPAETEVKYGGSGARKIFTWGKRSAEYFQHVAKENTEILVTGSPRFDAFLEQVRNTPDPRKAVKKLGVFTNPIDDQGFCSKDEKLALFESFIKRAAHYLNTNGISLGIKCHPREDLSEYMEISKKYVTTSEELPKEIKNAILEVEAGVIMASTVGLELLGARRQIGQMEIPGFGYVFDYTDHVNMVKIPIEGEFDLDVLFDETFDLTFFEEHIECGESADKIYNYIVR